MKRQKKITLKSFLDEEELDYLKGWFTEENLDISARHSLIEKGILFIKPRNEYSGAITYGPTIAGLRIMAVIHPKNKIIKKELKALK